MQLTMTPDEAVLRQLVGTTTFLRGREYARSGAVVVESRYREDQGHVFGQVHGSSRTPYSAIAILAKSAEGGLTSFRGSCTCPVRTNCKHAVALVLVTLPTAVTQAPRSAPLAAWERSLIDLVSAPPEPVEPVVALQFEISAASAKGRGAPRPGPAQLGLRPVVRGTNGGWVRTGISWSNIGYVSYSRRGIAPDHLRLLNEIMQLDSSSSASYYGGPSRAIPLESIASLLSGTCWPRLLRRGCR